MVGKVKLEKKVALFGHFSLQEKQLSVAKWTHVFRYTNKIQMLGLNFISVYGSRLSQEE